MSGWTLASTSDQAIKSVGDTLDEAVDLSRKHIKSESGRIEQVATQATLVIVAAIAKAAVA